MKKRIWKIAIILLAGLLLCTAAALATTFWLIHRSVQQYSQMAQLAHPHPGDDVAALIDFMNSAAHPIRDRNHAVWTLGRLQDPKALPALQAAYTGQPCDHPNRLCQHELEKAIKRCGQTPTPPRDSNHQDLKDATEYGSGIEFIFFTLFTPSLP